jgi:hypothetical protein
MLESLLQATKFAIHDRSRSWHSRHAPDECLEERHVFDQIVDSDVWKEVITGQVTHRRNLRASNGKEYPISYLPIASYALRYWAVMQIAAHANGLWTARVGAERLSSCGRRSLFLGRSKQNDVVYHAWMAAQNARYLLKADVVSFYDSIVHDKLIQMIETGLGNHRNNHTRMACDILPHLLRYRYRMEGSDEVHVCERGLPIGNTTERFFSNLYLAQIDDFLLVQPGIRSCRKLDDIRVYGDDKEQLAKIRDQLEDLLSPLGLRLNPTKTKIVNRPSTHT